MCRLENPDIDVLAHTLSNDPGLATKLLRVVNAPTFGHAQRVTTLRQATGLLGLNSVRTLALSFTIAQGMKPRSGSGFGVTQLVGAADLALYAAKRNGRNRVERGVIDLAADHAAAGPRGAAPAP